jgi:hypothetical protein
LLAMPLRRTLPIEFVWSHILRNVHQVFTMKCELIFWTSRNNSLYFNCYLFELAS